MCLVSCKQVKSNTAALSAQRAERKVKRLIQKIKLNLWTGTYTVIRDAGSVILTRRKTPAMSEFMKVNDPPDRDGYNLVYTIKRKEQET